MLTVMGLLMMFSGLGSAAMSNNAQLARLPAPNDPGQKIALHCVLPEKSTHEAVLFIHGASFPTMLAAGYEFKGRDSWLDFTAKRGLLACGLDFLGYGASSRQPAMSAAPDGALPLLRAPEAGAEIAAAAAYLKSKRGIRRLHVVAHSWGTIPAATYAATHPSLLASLTLFGPIVPVPGYEAKTVTFSWWRITALAREQQLRFSDILPPGMRLLEPEVDSRWINTFARSQPSEYRDADDNLRIPAGCIADIRDAKAGIYPYEQSKVKVPVFVVYGNYDDEVDDMGAENFLARFTSSPLKWRLRIDDGTHVMHLEHNRWSLYRSVASFISQVDGSQP